MRCCFPGPGSAGIASKPGYPTVLVPFGMIPNTPGPQLRRRPRRRGRGGNARVHDAADHDAGRDADSGRHADAARDHAVHAAGTAPAGLRSETAAVRRRIHRLRLQRADAAAARLCVRAGDKEADAAAGIAVRERRIFIRDYPAIWNGDIGV